MRGAALKLGQMLSIQDDAVIPPAIAKALEVNATVTNLFLHENNIGDPGATAIAEALRVNASVTELLLSGNKIGDNGAAAIANAIAVNASLKILMLQNTNIGDDGAKALASALEVNASLKLKVLWVPSAIKSNPQLVAACRAKGVELKSL